MDFPQAGSHARNGVVRQSGNTYEDCIEPAEGLRVFRRKRDVQRGQHKKSEGRKAEL